MPLTVPVAFRVRLPLALNASGSLRLAVQQVRLPVTVIVTGPGLPVTRTQFDSESLEFSATGSVAVPVLIQV